MKLIIILSMTFLSGCCYLTGNKCNLPKCDKPGATQCNGRIVQICSGGKEWVNHRKCPAESKCDVDVKEGIAACIK